ncbi:unnamed protein product [Calypogeia fissa]
MNTTSTLDCLSNHGTPYRHQVTKQSVSFNPPSKKTISPVVLIAIIASGVFALTVIAIFLFYCCYHKKYLRHDAAPKQADVEAMPVFAHTKRREDSMLSFVDAKGFSTPTPPNDPNAATGGTSNAAKKEKSTFTDPKEANEPPGEKSNPPNQPKGYRTDSDHQTGRWISWSFSGFKLGPDSTSGGVLTSTVEDMSGVSTSLPLADVKRATRNFGFKIGEGGFGPVYFGRLPGSQMEVAVKVQAKESRQGAREFATEVEILSRCKHPNLVTLVGYSEEEGGYMLVYEFLAGGTLQERLYGNRSNPPLDWTRRLKIAVQAAQGLEYLHNQCVPSIIHRDVKSNNILLTNLDDAKVTDFGLSKFLAANANHISKCSVKGTSGYLDPEYFETQKLTHKSDVYSFGIVLLELVSGGEPLDTNRHRSEWKITDWARNLLVAGNIEKVADKALKGKYDSDSMWTVAELAMTCVEPRSVHRPNITQVVKELEKAVKEQTKNGSATPYS